jgi:hypothetical protein
VAELPINIYERNQSMRRKKLKLPVKLKRGEKLAEPHRLTTGNLAQEDLDHYDVINARGEKVGTVSHTTSMSLAPPFNERHWLVQADLAGNVVVDARW